MSNVKTTRFRKYLLFALFPPFLLIALTIFYKNFVMNAFMTNMMLNGKILIALIIGAVLVIRVMWILYREELVLRRFKSMADAGSMKPMVDEAWLKGSEIGKVLIHIAEQDGKLTRMNQAAVEAEIESLEHGYEASFDIPNFMVGFLIALGLLGTFLGLLETLVGISALLDGITKSPTGNLDKAFMGLIGELQKPLAGMGTAFSASLFGLVGSLTVGVMMLALRGYSTALMKDLRHVVNELTEHTEGAFLIPRSQGVSEVFLSEFLSRLLEHHQKQKDTYLEDHKTATKLVLRMDKMTEQMEQVAKVILENVENTKKTNDLLSYGPRMRELSEQTLEAIKGLTVAIRQHTNSTGQHAVHMSEKISEGFSQLRDNQDFSRVLTSLSDIQSFLTAGLPAIRQIDLNIAEQLIREQKYSDRIVQLSKNLIDGLSAIKLAVGDLQTETDRGRQVQIDIARHVASQNAVLEGLRNGVSSIANIENVLINQISLTDLLIKEIVSAKASMVEELRAEMREMTRSLAK